MAVFVDGVSVSHLKVLEDGICLAAGACGQPSGEGFV